jgi:uncharacterized protein
MSEQSKLGSYQFGSEMKIYERFIFEYRPALLVFLFIATVFFAYQASHVKLDTSFLKMIPTKHPFIENMIANLDDIGAVGTVIQISVQTTDKDIFSKEYMETLQKISDETFFLPGVNRVNLESVWTPNVRWSEVTEEGFEGGPLIPNAYDGSPEKLAELRENILRSGRVGSLVADNFKSTIVQATLFDKDPDTGKPLDYHQFSLELEEKIRDKYQSDNIKIHVIGVAKLIGDLTDAGPEIAMFFVYAFIISFVLLIWYTRCIVSTLTLLICAVISVIWQLGLLQTLGMSLSAYSSLVPFLVFAISISHGIQNINTTALNMADGDNAFVASQRAFLSLYVAGMTALLGDGVGFITLWIIDIPAIKELAIAASIGIAVIIFTKLILLTIIMSYLGVSKAGVNHFKRRSEKEPIFWKKVSLFATPKYAGVSIAIAILITVSAFMVYGKNVKIGDLDIGAPELHPDSRYNLDNKFIADNYSVSSDIFLIMVKTTPDKCVAYENLEVLDRFGWTMENVEGVQSSVSMSFVVRQVLAGFSEGSLKWNTIPRDQQAIDSTVFQIPNQLVNSDCSYAPLILFLADHKAETLTRVVDAAEKFIKENPMKDLQFLLATGNAGIEAATNDVIVDAYYMMIGLVYLVVGFLVYISFNSVRATICIILPLVVTSILGDSLMAFLGIGIKVATLPVVALGVGIGVDYSIYIYAKLETYLNEGMSLVEAYYNTLKSTGNAIVLTALTLSIGVVTWAWSPIKFQADMGIMLTFMFLWNMIGAIWLLPALCCFLIKPERVIARQVKKANKKKKNVKPATL